VVTYEEESSRQVFNNAPPFFIAIGPTSGSPRPVRNPRSAAGWGWCPSVNDGRHPSAATAGRLRDLPSPAPARTRGGRGLHPLYDSDQVVKQLYLKSGNLPPRMSLFQDPELLRLHRSCPALRHGPSHPAAAAITRYAQASAILQRYLSAALTGRLEPGEAMQAARSGRGYC